MNTTLPPSPEVTRALQQALDRAVAASSAPGAVACVGDTYTTHFLGASGLRQRVPQPLPANADTLYDLASLTKVVATTTAILLLREDGALDLDRPVSDYLPQPNVSGGTIRHLMQHTAGLVSGRPYYRDHNTIDAMLARYGERQVDWTPGSARRYSDVGYMMLGRIVETVSKESLDRFCHRRIFEPLEMNRTAFNPPESWRENTAATERCDWRGRVIVGEVHDENAAAVGGVSGHAGLFSTASDLAKFCRALMNGGILNPESMGMMLDTGRVPFYPWQGLGWKLAPWSTSVEGYLPSRRAFGHTGWTGTSLWLDASNGRFAILLSNTCHPSRDARNNRALRQTFHDGVSEALYADRCSVHTGLDRLMYENFEPLQGKRYALLTNSAAVDSFGRSILDVMSFAPADARLRLLYSPEHGLKVQAEAGASVASTRLGDTPVISLYGDRKAPSAAELAEIDLFVVDLPDIGARYYTYADTMKQCIEACARARTPVLVLDRPNPLGGVVVEGPMPQRTTSPVCSIDVPVRHGLTLGEMAVWHAVHTFSSLQPQVMVHLLDGWKRNLYQDACDLPWVAPSPNIPDLETAVLYVGMCLFEGTNLNEGRGTDMPFHVFGAPWLRPDDVLETVERAALLGATLEPVQYTPRSIPGRAASPRFQDQPCQGIRVRIQDREKLRPFTVAVALITALQQTHRGQFELIPFFDTLMGSSGLREDILRGENATHITARYAPDHTAYALKRILRYSMG